jgi:WXXGXW repeat (2 copies)
MMNFRSFLLSSALSAAALFGALVPAAAQVYGGVYVQTAPPAPIYETAPAVPGPGYIWQAGYWRWNGYRYVWVHGHYVYGPYSGAVWRPGHWRQTPQGWVWVPGHWSHRYY